MRALMRCVLMQGRMVISDFVLHVNETTYFWDTLILLIFFHVIKTNNFRGYLTDVSAKTKTLMAIMHPVDVCRVTLYFHWAEITGFGLLFQKTAEMIGWFLSFGPYGWWTSKLGWEHKPSLVIVKLAGWNIRQYSNMKFSMREGINMWLLLVCPVCCLHHWSQTSQYRQTIGRFMMPITPIKEWILG